VHIAGWFITIGLAALAFNYLIKIANQPSTIIQTLISFFPYGTSVAVIYFFIATNTSHLNKTNKNANNNNETGNLRKKGGIDTYGGTLYFLAGCYFSCWL
jgi:hypothetical protein